MQFAIASFQRGNEKFIRDREKYKLRFFFKREESEPKDGRGFGLGFLLSRLRNEEEAWFYFRCEITRLSLG